jgi:hypothetical protein
MCSRDCVPVVVRVAVPPPSRVASVSVACGPWLAVGPGRRFGQRAIRFASFASTASGSRSCLPPHGPHSRGERRGPRALARESSRSRMKKTYGGGTRWPSRGLARPLHLIVFVRVPGGGTTGEFFSSARTPAKGGRAREPRAFGATGVPFVSYYHFFSFFLSPLSLE